MLHFVVACLFVLKTGGAGIYFPNICFFSAATTDLLLGSFGAALGSICMPMLARVFPIFSRVSGRPIDNS